MQEIPTNSKNCQQKKTMSLEDAHELTCTLKTDYLEVWEGNLES